MIHQRDRQRREQELAERAGRGAGAERKRPPSLRHQLAEGADHHGERATGKAETDQHAGRQVQFQRRAGVGHPDDAGDVEQQPADQHPDRAEAVGERARERLAGAPQQHLDRQRQREHVAAPAVGGAHRPEEEAERRARPEGDEADQAAADQDDRRRAPGRQAGGGHHAAVRPAPARARGARPAFPRSAD